jgi:hypothetical protein
MFMFWNNKDFEKQIVEPNYYGNNMTLLQEYIEISTRIKRAKANKCYAATCQMRKFRRIFVPLWVCNLHWEEILRIAGVSISTRPILGLSRAKGEPDKVQKLDASWEGTEAVFHQLWSDKDGLGKKQTVPGVFQRHREGTEVRFEKKKFRVVA